MTRRSLFGQNGYSGLTTRLVILNLAAVLFYFLVSVSAGQITTVATLMYSSPDARGYRDVADWQLGRISQPPDAATFRPFLYPLLLGGIRYLTHNAYAIWLVQFLFWLLAINLSSLSVFVLTKRVGFYTASFVVFALNVSAIIETFHALTEVLTLFLLALWVYVFVHDRPLISEPKRIAILILLMSLLVGVKPVFQLHLLLLVIYGLTYAIRRRAFLPLLFLAVLPVFVQLAIMFNLTNEVKISTIAERTIQKYLSSQVYALVNGVPLEEARSIVREYETGQQLELIGQNAGPALLLYVGNIMFQNMVQGSDLIGGHEGWQSFTLFTNAVYYGLHLVFLPLTILVALRRRGEALKIAVLYLFSVFIIASSGISFWQGDRLIMFAMPLWLVAYSGTIHQYILQRAR